MAAFDGLVCCKLFGEVDGVLYDCLLSYKDLVVVDYTMIN